MLDESRAGGNGIGEADVEGALVGVQTGVLHGEHPRLFASFVVVRVPPARRRDEDRTRSPIAADAVFHLPRGLVQHPDVLAGGELDPEGLWAKALVGAGEEELLPDLFAFLF